ncbi:MAG: glycosyltransferase family 39 protein [bacterium]
MGGTEQNGQEKGGPCKKAFPAAVGVFLLALAVRLIYLLSMQDSPYHDVTLLQGTDCYVFYRKAMEIASGDITGEGVYYQAPLYPYLVALIIKISGDFFQTAQRLFQFLLGSGVAVMVFYMARRLKGTAAGLTGGLLVALYGPLIFYEGAFLRAGVITFLYTLLVFLMLVSRERPGGGKALAVGAVFGLSLLAKPVIAVMLPVLALWWWDSGKQAKSPNSQKPGRRAPVRIKTAAGLLAGFVLIMTPLWLRNYKADADIFSMSRRGALEFVEGNYPGSPPSGWKLTAPVMEIVKESDRRLLPAIINVLRLYRDEPLQLLYKQADKTAAFLYGYEAPNNLNYYVEREYAPLLRFLPAWPHILGAGLLGLWFFRRRWREADVLYGFVILYCAATIAFYILGRFRLPVVPALCVFCGIGLTSLFDLLQKKRWPALAAALLVVFLAGLLSWPFQQTLLRPVDYYNLARFHAMQREPAKVHDWLEQGKADVEKMEDRLSPGEYHYYRGRYLFMGGKPLSSVQSELETALGKAKDPVLKNDIKNLIKRCERRREGKDRVYMGMRLFEK